MLYTLLFLQYTAHLLADFIFQPQKWCDVKESKLFSKEHIYHAVVVFVCSWALSLMVSFWWAALVIALFHLFIDIAKSYLFRKNFLKNYIFFIDQALHIISITIAAFLFSVIEGIPHIEDLRSPQVQINITFFLFAIIACTKPSNIFIRKYLEANHIFPVKKGNNTLLNAGRIIGSLERLLSFILISFNQFAAVGFIITTKSILRFRDTDTAKTEYLLIGSLLSFGIAILFGIAYQLIN
jgi:hypothetical protein